MNSKIVKIFEDTKSKNFDAEWIYFPSKKHGFVAVVEISPNKWVVNDNGNITEGDFVTISAECIKIATRDDEFHTKGGDKDELIFS